MRLTPQLRAEGACMMQAYLCIKKEYLELVKKASRLDRVSLAEEENCQAIIAELNPYKVRLENIFCETDIKEQVHSH